IGATHILGTALHPPHRGCGTETGKQLPGGGTEPKPMTPLVKRASLHHTGRPPGASAYRGSPYGRERTRFTVPQQVLTHILAISTHILAQKFLHRRCHIRTIPSFLLRQIYASKSFLGKDMIYN